VLLLFDFDHTVCDGNTDTWILRALPLAGGRTETAAADDNANADANAGDADANDALLVSARHRLPRSLRKCASDGWTAYMQRIFDYAHEQGVAPSDLRAALQSIPLTPGFGALLAAVERTAAAATAAATSSPSASASAVSAGVISDSNTLFIDWTLEAHGLDAARLFSGAGVHTNPASITAAAEPGGGRQGARLVVSPHEPRAGPGHGCPNCPPNLCKAKRMRAIAAEKTHGAAAPPRVAYVGDGGNDACPAAALAPGDVVFARRGMALCGLLAGGKVATAAAVVRWDSGEEILAWLRENWGVLVD